MPQSKNFTEEDKQRFISIGYVSALIDGKTEKQAELYGQEYLQKKISNGL